MKTIDRDALMKKLKNEFDKLDSEEESLFLAGYSYAAEKVFMFPAEERYTLEEAMDLIVGLADKWLEPKCSDDLKKTLYLIQKVEGKGYKISLLKGQKMTTEEDMVKDADEYEKAIHQIDKAILDELAQKASLLQDKLVEAMKPEDVNETIRKLDHEVCVLRLQINTLLKRQALAIEILSMK